MGATTEASHLNEFHVPVSGLGQGTEIREVRGRDVVGILGKQDERCVDDVRGASTTEQRARAAPKLLVQRADVDALQRPRQQRLPGPAGPPDLADHAAVGHRQLSR